MIDNSLVVRSDADVERALATVTDDVPMHVAGTELLGREDLSIPRLILVQAQSKDIPDGPKHVGEWYNNLTGEFSTQFRGVLMGIAQGRVAYDRKYNSESDPVCASDDGDTPRYEYQGSTVRDSDLDLDVVIDGDCSVCPLAQFGPEGQTPLCAKSYNYAMLDIDSGFPVILQMKRTATKEARKINTVAQVKGNTHVFQLRSNLEKGPSGQYYVPVFVLGERTPPDVLAECRKLSAELGNIASRVAKENGAHKTEPMQDEESEIPF